MKNNNIPILAIKDHDTGWHHGSACLLIDGLPRFAVESERVSRNKYDPFAKLAIDYCLKHADLKKEDVNLLNLEIKNTFIYRNLNRIVNWKLKYNNKYLFENYFLAAKNNTTHHHAHMASAFFPSAFKEAAILSVDGVGDYHTTVFGIGKQNKIKTIKSLRLPHSLGFFYTAMTEFLGFYTLDPGKTMGLAPYGKMSKYYDKLAEIAHPTKNGEFYVDESYIKKGNPFFTSKLIDLIGYPRLKNKPITRREEDIAFAVQKITEDIMLHMANYLYEKTKLKNICLAGGVALNSVANKKVLDGTPFENIFIQPASHDGGISLGLALYHYHQIQNNPRKYIMKHAYLGKEHSLMEIGSAIDKYKDKIKFRKSKDIAKEIASNIAEKKIIGWFQGGSEFGPRALGHRSILCDARDPKMKDILNARVKHREGFRPFAPSVLLEESQDYFDIECESPFMLLVADTKQSKRKEVPSIVHVDGSARVQTVTKEENGIYYDLVKAFKDITGTPLILNTSFNVAGEPVVETPEDALHTFTNTDIDVLALGDYIIEKNENSSSSN
jgi:carbamoyltransferase